MQVADHMIVYEDGTIGFNDWKTGSSFERKNDIQYTYEIWRSSI